jgi:sulfopyruvate decarboxylase subunit alpha
VVSMRGSLGEANPSQVPLGRSAVQLLSTLGIQAFSVRTAAAAAQVTAGAVTLAFQAGECAALMLEPELGGGREGS